MKIFITKYALTTGIIETETEETNLKSEDIIRVRSVYFWKKDYRTSLEEAQEQAQKMILARIASLERSVMKVKNLQGQPIKVRKWEER